MERDPELEATSHAVGAGSTGRVLRIVGLTLAFLMALEAIAEYRLYLRYGITVLDTIREHSLYVYDRETGLRLLRPNAVVRGQLQSIQANSLGLRSPEISVAPPADSLRVAVIGASSVMGATERDNEHTFPSQLENLLREALPYRHIEVINAGIAGYSLADERTMLERLIAPLRPDLVILYTGFNDFATYCRGSARPAAAALPMLSVPNWWLSYELLKKNTTALRTGQASGPKRNAHAIDLEPYRAQVEQLVASGQRLGMRLVMLTNARSFRREQPMDEQLRLSSLARYYTPCFELDGLHTLWDRHNEVLVSVARARGIPVLELDRMVPGGEAYFADGRHFTERGDRVVAHTIARFLLQQRLVDTEDAL
jgi:lysophospholipase L1-like esterase